MLLILLVGGVYLFSAHRQQMQRIDALERELAAVRMMLVRAPVEPERERRPAAIIVTSGSAPEADPEPGEEPFPAFAPVADAAPAPVEAVAPEPVEEPARAEAPPAADGLATLFERFVGGRLLIWIGGIAFAAAGVFLVQYSIELGLIGPRVRMIMAAFFGAALIGAGELARRRTDLADDRRIAQALVGAGIFVLYATVYGSLTLYGLISLGAASILMAGVTAAALGLSLRHGVPTAVMGLVGGFLTPLLVGDPASGAVPLLFYLALLNLALIGVSYRRGWTWLAAAGVLLTFLLTGALLFSPERGDALAAGAFVVALGIAGSLTSPGQGRHLRLIAPAMIGLVQLAVLVARTDLDRPAWGLFGALSLACLVLAALRREHRWLPVAALLLALLLLSAEYLQAVHPLAIPAAGGIGLLFGAFGYPLAVRGPARLIWTGIACAATAGPAIILRLGDADLLAPAFWGGIEAALALAPAGLAALHARRVDDEGRIDWPLLVSAATAALLAMIALSDWLPVEWLPAAWLLVALAVALARRRVRDRGLVLLASAAGLYAAAAAFVLGHRLWSTLLLSVYGEPALASALPSPFDGMRLLLIPAALLALLWRMLPPDRSRVGHAIAASAALLGAGAAYLFYKQVFSLAGPADFAAHGFAERMLLTQALFAAGWLAGSGRVRRVPSDVLRVAALVLTGIAAARLVWFDLLLHNPVWIEQRVGPWPVVNLLLPAFLGSAFWLYLARRRSGTERESGVWLGLFLVALIAGTALLVRQAFQGSLLNGFGIPLGERYGYSLAGLLLSIALLAAGMRVPDRALRVAGLALLTATILKVFLIDASALAGILRILSFMGLGVALIGVGKLYMKVLGKPSSPAPATGAQVTS